MRMPAARAEAGAGPAVEPAGGAAAAAGAVRAVAAEAVVEAGRQGQVPRGAGPRRDGPHAPMQNARHLH